MAHDEQPGLLDRAVDRLAQVLNGLGLNGTRLRWRWNQRRKKLAEAGLEGQVLLRQSPHKMCPACRALVSRDARTCPECAADLSAVRAPGVGRLVSNLFPGMAAATSLLMLVNGFWFIMLTLAQVQSASSGTSLFDAFDPDLLIRFGSGLSRPVALPDGQIAGGEWWRVITPIFLHAGILHFFFNSYLLFQLGPVVEEIYGTPRCWVIYLCCGIAGSLASQLPRPVNTVGASGAIMGLIGLLFVHGTRRGGLLGQSVKQMVLRLLVYSLVLNLFFAIDHLNHLGGFACGAALALLVPARSTGARQEAALWQAASLAGVLLVLFAFYQVAVQGRLAGGA